jgi:hypothetical protein
MTSTCAVRDPSTPPWQRAPRRGVSHRALHRPSACLTLGIALFGSVLFGAAVTGRATPAAAEPLVTEGIGTSSCARLAADLNPAEGLANPVNLMLYAWVQGYVSAANIALLEDNAKHIDLSALDDGTVLNLVLGYCKANPDKKPIAAIDELIRKAAKIKTRWESGTVEWAE